MPELTYEQKVEKYQKGLYQHHAVPPRASFYWRGPKPWIMWIDSQGEWLDEPQREQVD